MIKPCHIIIIEPSDVIRTGLLQILRSVASITKIDEAKTWDIFINEYEDMDYDMVLLNPVACSSDGKLTGQILEKIGSSLLIGIITTLFSRNMLNEYTDVIYLTDSESEINKLITRHLSQKSENKPLHRLLSDREIEVLRQFARGLATKEIAEKLNISTHTVISHRKNISSKLGIKSTSGMAIYAVTAKIIDPSDILDKLPKKGD